MSSTESTLAVISRSDLQDLETPLSASITNVKHLASYNWIEAPTPTIAVPGCPPLWSVPAITTQLKKDTGFFYIAQNAARHPESPLEPLFRALYITNPSFDIRAIDIVTDRNNMRKLLAFINPDSTRDGREAFTIGVEVMKNTAVFGRMETATQRFIGPREFRGFGHEFEKAYTTSRISGSTGHHRIISYSFGNRNFVVRYETDGFVDDGARTSSSDLKQKEDDGLASMLGSLSLTSANNSLPSITPPGSKLTIKEEGQVVPLESTLEIKTRVSHKPLRIGDVAPQLWISQTPKLVRAYHHQGTFERPKVEDVSAHIRRWEGENQKDLRKLAALIDKILSVVKGGGGTAVIRYDDKEDKMVVSKTNGKPMLPKDLYSKWDDGDTAESNEAKSVEKDVERGETEGAESMKTKGKHESAALKKQDN